MLSCVFNVFFCVFSTFSDKVVQTWFVCHETWHTTPFGIFFYVLKWLESKTIGICLKLRAKLGFWGCLAFLAFFSRIKWCKLVLFGTKLGTQHYLVYVIVFKWLEWKMNIHMLEITCLVAFFRLFYRFWHFSNKVVQTWFV